MISGASCEIIGNSTIGSISGAHQASLLEFGFTKTWKDRSPLKENRDRQEPPAKKTVKGLSDMGTICKESAKPTSPASGKKRSEPSTPADISPSVKVAKASPRAEAPAPLARSTPKRDRKPPAKAILEAKLLDAAEATRVKREAKRKKDREVKRAETAKLR